MTHPIPDSALDDRFFFGGTAGSGKTYNAMSRVERLLARKSRVVTADPLGVWWGLRLSADGKHPSGYDVVIFGGPHGDLPLTEHAGALIGETVASMKESCILDLSQLGTKAAERRFMLAFLTALYRHTPGEPLHIIFDEADMWAPQKLLDRDGDAARLLGMMETIVRRGRVKGFIPWLISQRPAVVTKDILSQVDGIIIFKLTSSQDRAAIEAWVEGQADKKTWQDIESQLPMMVLGRGLVWIPGRGILDTVQFPPKETFDSSRTPKRGEKLKRTAALKPIDLGAVKDRLASVETEAKANDPKALKAEIAKLKAELAKKPQTVTQTVERAVIEADPKAIAAAEKRSMAYGRALGVREGYIEATALFDDAIAKIAGTQERANNRVADLHKAADAAASRFETDRKTKSGLPSVSSTPVAPSRAIVPSVARSSSSPAASGDGTLTPSLQKCLDAIAWWRKISIEPVHRDRACVVAGFSPKASTFGVYIAELVKRGLVAVTPGHVQLTPEGIGLARTPDAATASDLRDMARSILGPKECGVFDIVYDAYPNPIRRDAVAEAAGLSPTASTCGVYLAAIAAYGIIETAGPGQVRAADWLFP